MDDAGLIDISPVINEELAVFPGDVPFVRGISLDLEEGDYLTLSSVQSTVHIGAHADAPSHYSTGGASIDARPLDLYFGPCQVVRVAADSGARIGPEAIPGGIVAPRLLICTGSFPDPTTFNDDFVSLSPALVDYLAGQGVRLIGIDTPSIDPADSKAMESHGAAARHDMAILEGLVLDHVPAGRYTLIALPLKIEGADGAPVRAAFAPW